MDARITKELSDLNRVFYERFGESFSATRQRLQPGVLQILEEIQPDQSVLDLGCGNGNFLRELQTRGHHAARRGADFSPPLLREAEAIPQTDFCQADLTRLSQFMGEVSIVGGWDVIVMFATLHHIPSNEIRLELLQTVKRLLHPKGKFYLSNWQFLNSEKLKARVQAWSRIGLSAADVDAGDYLLDWRGGGEGLRYAHQFSAEELRGLANQIEMRVAAQFLSDGKNGRLGLYQIWQI